jgi:hypothetical protein
MQRTWTAPQYEESNLGSEIGTYWEQDEDDPSFSFTRKTSPRRRAVARDAEARLVPSDTPVGAAQATDEPCE